MHKNIVAFIRRRKIVTAIAALILVAVVYFVFFAQGPRESAPTATVQRGDVRNIVSVSGRVQPAEEVNLAFGAAGRVGSINARVGERVAAGQHLASLESGVLAAEYERLSAQLSAEEIRLQQLYAGPSGADIGVSVVSVEAARADVSGAEQSLANQVVSARTNADVAVRTYLDSLFTSPTSSSPGYGVSIQSGTTNYQIGSSSAAANVNAQRRQVQDSLDELYELSLLEILENPQQSVEEVRQTLLQIQLLADYIAADVNALHPADATAQSIYSTYKSNVVSARNTATSALSSLNSAQQAFIGAQFALTSAQRQLELKQEGPTNFEVALQQASIDQVRAQLRGAAARLAEARIVSPIAGVVTAVALHEGEIAGGTNAVITVISDEPYQIETFVPEIDVAAVGVGDEANVSFDALGSGRTSAARVAQVEPAQTKDDGVATYRVILFLNEPLEGLRVGMSADVDIVAEVHEDVLSVPARALLRRGGETFVRIPAAEEGAEPQLVPVQTGIRGQEGSIEIVSGLREGETILSTNEGT